MMITYALENTPVYMPRCDGSVLKQDLFKFKDAVLPVSGFQS